MSNRDVLVSVAHASKKFCKSLKKSMRYGLNDLARDVVGLNTNSGSLRPEEFWGVQDIDFELRRGECLGIIGQNGSGKSTLLKMLNGIILPDKGQIGINGKIGALLEVGAGFHPMLTGRENVYINGSILGFKKKEIDEKFDDIVAFAELEHFIDTPVKNYSSGMYVRLGFAIAAQMKPDILLIDEVLAVGDVGFRAKCYSVISEFLKNTAVVFVSHSMPEIARLCNRIMVLKSGICQYLGSDVSKGIDQYYLTHDKPRGVVYASPTAELKAVQIDTAEESPIPSIPFNGDLSIKIEAYVDPAVRAPIFHVAVLNQSLHNVCHCSSKLDDQKARSDDGHYNLKLTIPQLNLKPGRYYLDFAINENNNVKIIARTHMTHEFQITGTFPGYGTILPEGRWEILH